MAFGETSILGPKLLSFSVLFLLYQGGLHQLLAMAEECGVPCKKGETRPVILLVLHGSGDTGPGFRNWIQSLMSVIDIIPDYGTVLFPTAALQPYTPMQGMKSNVWFDRHALAYDVIEDEATIADSVVRLNTLISSATDSSGREPIILLMGFSMGGSMALHLAFERFRSGVSTHGVVVLSSFIGRDSTVIPTIGQGCIKDNSSVQSVVVPDIKMIHGTADEMISIEWGRDTATRLKENGFTIDLVEVKNVGHQLSHRGLQEVQMFIFEMLEKHRVS